MNYFVMLERRNSIINNCVEVSNCLNSVFFGCVASSMSVGISQFYELCSLLDCTIGYLPDPRGKVK